MERLDKILAGLSIPVNISQANTPISSTESNVCEKCHGAGYLRMDVPVDNPNFGRLYPCECKVREISSRNHSDLAQRSNLEAFTEKTFLSFDENVPGTRAAFLAAKEYARNPSGWLLIVGTFGCGKTHLAAAIANQAIGSGLQTYFAIAPDLLDTLRSAYAPDSGMSYDDRFDSIRTVPLLIVDDLGTENTTPWAKEKLYQIFNHRYNHRLPTVVTSNVDLDAMDPRIASRLCDQQLCKQIYMEAADYRKAGAQARRPGFNPPNGTRFNGRKPNPGR